MSVTPPEATPAPPTEQPPPATGEEQLGDAGKKALAAERKRASDAEKARQALETELQSIKDRDLSDLQRAQKTAQEAEKRAEAASREALRFKVAAEVGIPADLLAGDTEDALRTYAERLKAFKGEAPAPTTPRADPSQGSRPATSSVGREAGLAEARRRFGDRTKTHQ